MAHKIKNYNKPFQYPGLITLILIVAIQFLSCNTDTGLGPETEEAVPLILTKPITYQEPNLGTKLGIKVIRKGRHATLTVIKLSRSVSGRAPEYLWQGGTDKGEWTQITIGANPSGQFRNKGTGGYYTAIAVDATFGDFLESWSSIPLQGKDDEILLLPFGGKASVLSSADTVSIGNIYIEQAARETLHRPTGPLLNVEIENLTELFIYNSNLTGL